MGGKAEAEAAIKKLFPGPHFHKEADFWGAISFRKWFLYLMTRLSTEESRRGPYEIIPFVLLNPFVSQSTGLTQADKVYELFVINEDGTVVYK